MPENGLSVAAIALMKGVVYRDTHEQAWQQVVRLQPQLRDHMGVLGLAVVVDESEGYSYLRSLPHNPESPLPRLVPRHKLSLHTSLLLALLRRRLAEFDAGSTEGRLVVTREELIALMRTFLAETTNESRTVDQVDRAIGRVTELGFLPAMPATTGAPPAWEVRRIVKAFVDAQWLDAFDARLREYAAQLAGPSPKGNRKERNRDGRTLLGRRGRCTGRGKAGLAPGAARGLQLGDLRRRRLHARPRR